jgi:hypothetical protein
MENYHAHHDLKTARSNVARAVGSVSHDAGMCQIESDHHSHILGYAEKI